MVDGQQPKLSIEQFVAQEDAASEAQKGATGKFQEQLHSLQDKNSVKEQGGTGGPGDQSEGHMNFLPGDKELGEFMRKKPSIPEQFEELRKKARQASDQKSQTLENDTIIGKKLEGYFGKHWPREVTPEDRKEAKDTLGKEISPLINDGDAKTLKSMQEAIVDGNVGKLAEIIKSMPPERVKAFVKELNKELKEHHAGVQLSATGDGRVFLYQNSGQTAIQINRDGTTQLKPITHSHDGSVVVEPGEIINKDADEVMKDISDSAVRGITGRGQIIWNEKPWQPIDEPIELPRPHPHPPGDWPPRDWPRDWPPIKRPPIDWEKPTPYPWDKWDKPSILFDKKPFTYEDYKIKFL